MDAHQCTQLRPENTATVMIRDYKLLKSHIIFPWQLLQNYFAIFLLYTRKSLEVIKLSENKIFMLKLFRHCENVWTQYEILKSPNR